MKKQLIGEVVGTFILVFFGCGAVAGSVLFGSFEGLFDIAAIWGIAVALAITLARPLSGAHLNPAMTLAFALMGDFKKRKIPLYFFGQFLGAFLAAVVLYLLFGSAIESFELEKGITRGSPGSEQSALIFGEYFDSKTPMRTAFLAEFLGTALLAFFVFGIVEKEHRTPLPNWLIPFSIGLALTILISIFAPLSMAGFNPARDLAPRIFSMLAGWETHPFRANGAGWLVVYVLAPFLGGPIGALLAKKLLK